MFHRCGMSDNKGVTAVEYGLIGALISVVILGSVALTGTDTKEVFCVVSANMETAMGMTETGTCKTAQTVPQETIAEMVSSSKDKVDTNLIPVEDGGSGVMGGPWASWDSATMVRQLETLNASDPIVGIVGLYHYPSAVPIENYADALSAFQNNEKTSYPNSDVAGPNTYAHFEAITASGKAYDLNLSGNVKELSSK